MIVKFNHFTICGKICQKLMHSPDMKRKVLNLAFFKIVRIKNPSGEAVQK